MQLKPNKKLLQNHLVCLTGKPVILKDLHNISAKTTKGFDFRELITKMKTVKGIDTFDIIYFIGSLPDAENTTMMGIQCKQYIFKQLK